MPTDSMIQAEGLKKRYGETVALAGVDLEVPAGSILGMLGPNGAGKTTAVRILTTLALPDGGRARVAGYDVVTEAASGAAQHRRHRPGRHARRAADRPPEPGHDRAPERPAPRRGASAGRELLEQFELADAADRVSRATRAACAGASTWPPAS